MRDGPATVNNGHELLRNRQPRASLSVESSTGVDEMLQQHADASVNNDICDNGGGGGTILRGQQ
jgi:hypothetical protein